MSGQRKLAAGLLLACLGASQAGTQPPPPPPPNFPDYVHVIDDAYNKRDLAAFAKPFAEDVKVYVDGALVASGKAQLLDRIKGEFEQSLTIHPVSSAQGSEVIAFEIVVGCIPDRPDPSYVYHGCPTMRAVRYDIGDDRRVVAMHILPAKAWNIHSEPRNWFEF